MAETRREHILSRSEKKKILWSTIEKDFVENGTRFADIQRKYKVTKSLLFRMAKIGNWREKRKNFLKVQDQKVHQKEVLSVAERRDRLVEWLRSMTESLHIRAMTFISDQNERAQLPNKDERHFEETTQTLREIVQVLLRLDALRKAAFGEEIGSVEHDVTYEVIVEEQRPRVRIVKSGEEKREQEIIEIPEEDVTELGLVISPAHICGPTNGEAKPSGSSADSPRRQQRNAGDASCVKRTK